MDSGAFSHFYDACVIFGIGLSFTVFKCVRERVVLALWLPTPVRALLFAAALGLANWADLTYGLPSTGTRELAKEVSPRNSLSNLCLASTKSLMLLELRFDQLIC